MARQHKRSAYRTCREVHDPRTHCAPAYTICNRRVALLGASAHLSGLESRDQMASVSTRDELLNGKLREEARGSQLGDPRRRRYSCPTAIALERIRAGSV